MHLVLKRPEIVEKAAIIDICPQTYTLDRQTMHRSLSEYILTTRFKISTDVRKYIERSGNIFLQKRKFRFC